MDLEVVVADEAGAAAGYCAEDRALGAGEIVNDVGWLLVRHRTFQTQVDIADVVLEVGLCDEASAAALVVGPGLQVRGACDVDLAADEAESFVRGADVDGEIVFLCELLVAALPRAGDRLAGVDGDARVAHLDVPLQLPLPGALVLAEDAVEVFLTNVCLEQRDGREADLCLAVAAAAFFAPELRFAVVALGVVPESPLGVEAGAAAGCRARVCVRAQVFRPDVSLEGVVLAEALGARREVAAPEALLACVDVLVTAQSRRRQEGLAAVFVGADVGPLLGVGALDVLAEVLLLAVVFVAAGVGALERSVIRVGTEVGGQAGGPVERLVAVWIRAWDGLEI